MTLSTDTRLVEALAKALLQHDATQTTRRPMNGKTFRPIEWDAIHETQRELNRDRIRVVLDELEKIHPGILPLYPLGVE